MGFAANAALCLITPHDEFIIKPEAISRLKNHRFHLYLANKILRKNLKLSGKSSD